MRTSVCSGSSGIVVMADPVRLSQVCANLLHNAVKYTPDGGHIVVGLQQDGGDAVIRVRDDGIGIRPEDFPRLFDFFSRGESGQNKLGKPDGLGVGLALAKQLVERQGGALEGHSDGPDSGSEFVVRMPALSQVNDTVSAAGADLESATPVPARRVLVVDDNPVVAEAVKVLLETMGHQVRVLLSGHELIETIRAFEPDVVFLDIGIPERDGYQLAADIRAAALEPSPFLVALTGYGQESDRDKARRAGFDRHLLKPAGPKEIEALLAAVQAT